MARSVGGSVVVALALLVASCGGSSPGGPNPLPSATPPVEVRDVVGVVFYDEDGGGTLDGSEKVRLGDVDVEIAGKRGRSEKVTGRVVVAGVPLGSATLTVRTETLPPYYASRGPISVTVPQAAGSELPIPLTLPTGSNRPNRYMAFGDSITEGDGSSDGSGYRDRLAADLQATLGAAAIVTEAYPGTRSNSGALRLPEALAIRRPAYTLILYGTNDWNDCGSAVPCFTVDSLRHMVQSARGVDSLPILATIIPANPDFPVQVPPERNLWVHQIDELVRSMAKQEGAPVADLEAAFLAEPSLPALYSDHIHPNDSGYAIIAREFFNAITSPRGSASGGAFEPAFDLSSFGFASPTGRLQVRGRLAPPRGSPGGRTQP